jgi:hypothetical protein
MVFELGVSSTNEFTNRFSPALPFQQRHSVSVDGNFYYILSLLFMFKATLGNEILTCASNDFFLKK